MKNSKGISLIALIITIIVIIILAAIVIGGVFNTPNDAKFANFCQEYDRVQTAIQMRYYELYQKYALQNTTEVPTHYQIYFEVASGTPATADNYLKDATHTAKDESRWVKITGWSHLTGEKPNGLNDWYLRTDDGKLAYNGFEKDEGLMYYTPNVYKQAGTGVNGAAARHKVEASTTGVADITTANTTDLNKIPHSSTSSAGLMETLARSNTATAAGAE